MFKSLPFGSMTTEFTTSIPGDVSVSSREDSIWKPQRVHQSSKREAYLQRALITLPMAGLKRAQYNVPRTAQAKIKPENWKHLQNVRTA